MMMSPMCESCNKQHCKEELLNPARVIQKTRHSEHHKERDNTKVENTGEVSQ